MKVRVNIMKSLDRKPVCNCTFSFYFHSSKASLNSPIASAPHSDILLSNPIRVSHPPLGKAVPLSSTSMNSTYRLGDTHDKTGAKGNETSEFLVVQVTTYVSMKTKGEFGNVLI